MQFNSLVFPLFLAITLVIYWSIGNQRRSYQNLLLIIASYIFYGWWDWRFLSLIIISSSVDYIVGHQLGKTNSPNTRKALLLTSIIVNLSILGFFKYFNFFIDSFIVLFEQFGYQTNLTSLNIILPIGISFYTLQTLSYPIDVYRKKMPATHDPIAFFAFVSFFPQLVAGPIERATRLLPQFLQQRQFNNDDASDGLRRILWGLFKKVVIADSCAICADYAFSNHNELGAALLLFGAICFAFQIYCDFSGYSDIAIGTARLFGFKLMENFSTPYFSRSIGEFWRRWHISLSSWFRNYIYIPLGGSRTSTPKTVRNIFVTFSLSGLWHGASWTFIFWGILHSLYYLPSIFRKKIKNNHKVVTTGRALPDIKELTEILTTFFLITLAWIVFRAETLSDAVLYIYGIFTKLLIFDPNTWVEINTNNAANRAIFFILGLIVIEWIQRRKPHPLYFNELGFYYRWPAYYLLTLTGFAFFGQETPFIYFQF